jgi:diacylglycerol kinase (ATP)
MPAPGQGVAAPRAVTRRPLLLVVNPASGGKPASPGAGQRTWDGDPASLVTMLRDRGLEAELHVLASSEDPGLIAGRAATGGRDVAVAGGDGTVHPVAAALVGGPATLGILPLGSYNNIARGAGLPLELDAAADRIARGKVSRIDVGLAWHLEVVPVPGAPAPEPSQEAVPFFEAAGAGLDAAGFGAAHVLGRRGIRFALGVAWRAFRRRETPVVITVDGDAHRMTSPAVTVCNGPYHGFGFALVPDADVADGLLDVVAFRDMSRPAVLGHFLRTARGRPPAEPRLWVRRARWVVVDGERTRLPVHADGRAIGRTPAAVTIRPGALRIFR